MTSFGFNVMDFGAKADGITDDTQAIQAAIDFCAKRGGGRVRAIPHIAPAEQTGIEELEKEIEKALS